MKLNIGKRLQKKTNNQNQNMPTLDEICNRLSKLLELEKAKKGTVKARTIEWGCLQGIATCLGNETPGYIIICMASGRSILDK